MTKKNWLIIITILFILVVGTLYWYLSYQFTKTSPSREEAKKEEIIKEVIEETTGPEEEGESFKSIPLEKPPFIK